MGEHRLPETDPPTWGRPPDGQEERLLLTGSRKHPEELARAGRVFLEFVHTRSLLVLLMRLRYESCNKEVLCIV